jgi:hypothetical protein
MSEREDSLSEDPSERTLVPLSQVLIFSDERLLSPIDPNWNNKLKQYLYQSNHSAVLYNLKNQYT